MEIRSDGIPVAGFGQNAVMDTIILPDLGGVPVPDGFYLHASSTGDGVPVISPIKSETEKSSFLHGGAIREFKKYGGYLLFPVFSL